MKTCPKCKLPKEDGDFHKNQVYCITCNAEYFQENKERIQARRKQYRLDHPEAKKKQWEQAKLRRISNRERHLWTSAKDRAAKAGTDFSISISDIVIPERCPLLETVLTKGEMRRNDPSAPSLDRIDNSKGYTLGNVRVISYKANMMKNNATKEEIETFCKNIKTYICQ